MRLADSWLNLRHKTVIIPASFMPKPTNEPATYTQRLARAIDTAYEHYKPDDPSTHKTLHAAFRAQARNVVHYRLREDNYHLADDITHRAMMALPTFRGASVVSTWFLTIARNEVNRHLRKHIRDRERFLPLNTDGEIDTDSERKSSGGRGPNVDVNHDDMDLENLQDKLPKQQSRVVALKREGYTLEEIAEITGKRPGTVFSQYQSAKKKLKDAFKSRKKKARD